MNLIIHQHFRRPGHGGTIRSYYLAKQVERPTSQYHGLECEAANNSNFRPLTDFHLVMDWKRLYIFLLLILVLLNNSQCHTPGKRETRLYYKVTRVVDGDTFWIDNGTEKGEKVRLIGVDAPESRKTSRKEIGFFGKESKRYLSDLLLNNEVRIEYDVDHTDRYGRTLAYVYLKDGTFVNAELVKQGYAMVMTVPPNVKYAEKFVRYQVEARQHNRGLWDK